MRKRALTESVLAALLLCGCSEAAAGTMQKTVTASSAETAAPLTEAEQEDANEDYKDNEAVKITFKGDTAEGEGKGFSITGNTLKITSPGIYVLSGIWNEGKIVINCEQQGTVRLVLSSAVISSSSGPVIEAEKAEKVIVTSYKGTENSINAAGADENDRGHAVYTKDDIVFNGSGTLNISAAAGDGIHANDDLTIINTVININASDDGIQVNNEFRESDSILNIEASSDGIKTGDTDDEAASGLIYLYGGMITVNAGDDGIQTSGDIYCEYVDLNITAGGGYENAETKKSEDMFIPGGFGPGSEIQGQSGNTVPSQDNGMTGNSPIQSGPGGMTQMPGEFAEGGRPQEDFGEYSDHMPEFPEGEMPDFSGEMPDDGFHFRTPFGTDRDEEFFDSFDESYTDSEAVTENGSSAKAKGISADGSVTIVSGTYTVNSADDAVNAQKNITISAGTFRISAGDDGMHADDTLTIGDGEITVLKSYEGLEAKYIVINGGEIDINADDDGINTVDGSYGGPEMTADESILTVNGGNITVSASGDGIDMNGSGTVNGGTLVVYGPENQANGAIDYESSFTVNGGTVIAGGASGMAMYPSEDSGEYTVAVLVSGKGTVYLKDSSGNTVLEYTSEKSFQSVSFTSADLKESETYTAEQDGAGIGSVTVSDKVSYIGQSGRQEFFENGMDDRTGSTPQIPSEGGRPEWEDTENGDEHGNGLNILPDQAQEPEKDNGEVLTGTLALDSENLQNQ